MKNQPGILNDVPSLARYLFLSIHTDKEVKRVIHSLNDSLDVEHTVVGLGQSLLASLGVTIEGMRTFPSYTGKGFEVPSTPTALWFWLKGNDRGELLHRTLSLEKALSPAFRLDKTIDAFKFAAGHDLTGYEDGTENPTGQDAENVAIVESDIKGIDGSSFVAVQQWVHDLASFQSMSQQEQDNTIGRRKSDNEEIEDAPESAHVKRTAQESFEPEAFIVRRSMPWANEQKHGLVFVAFGNSFDSFEALLKRMVGFEDGVSDALFKFTRPVTGSYFWCPPVLDGHLDLSQDGFLLPPSSKAFSQ